MRSRWRFPWTLILLNSHKVHILLVFVIFFQLLHNLSVCLFPLQGCFQMLTIHGMQSLTSVQFTSLLWTINRDYLACTLEIFHTVFSFILSLYLSMVVLMLSIRVGGGGGSSSPIKPTCTSLVLHYWSLNCCHVALALICQAMVRFL